MNGTITTVECEWCGYIQPLDTFDLIQNDYEYTCEQCNEENTNGAEFIGE